jgi:type IX secretion system PorP/SprF family membrane protein
MKNKILLLANGFWLMANGLFAQQLPLTDQYTVNKFVLSPAYAGTSEAFEIFGTYRNEWVGISGAPDTKIITADGLVCKNMGIGGSISSIEAGIFRNQSASFTYAYHAKLGATQTLSFGLSIGLLESHVDVTSAGAQTDPVVANAQNFNSLVLDGGFGMLYRCKNFHAAFSLPQMLGSKIKNADGNTIYALAMQPSINVGYKYAFNSDWTIDPIVKVTKAINSNTSFELAVPIMYKQKVWLVPIYKNTAFGVGFGGMPYGNFIAQYSYEFSSTGMLAQSSGTHEITIGWRMQSSKKKTDVPAPDSKKPYYQWLNK